MQNDQLKKINTILPDVRILYHGFVQIGNWNFEHNHMPFWRLYYNFAEGALLKHAKQTINLEPNKIILISPDTEITTAAAKEKHIKHFFVHFDISCIAKHQPSGIFEVDASDMHPLINMICRENKDFNGLRNTLRVRSLVTFLLSHLPDDILHLWMLKSNAEERILSVINYLQENYQKKPTNEELAAVADISVNQLLRDFKNHTGLPPQTYLRREQIRNACILMNSTTLSIDEVAEQTGFFDRYHFSKIFRRVTGLPPAAYRKKFTFHSR